MTRTTVITCSFCGLGLDDKEIFLSVWREIKVLLERKSKPASTLGECSGGDFCNVDCLGNYIKKFFSDFLTEQGINFFPPSSTAFHPSDYRADTRAEQ